MKKYFKKIIFILPILAFFLLAGGFALAGSVDVGLDYGDNIGLGTADPIEVTINIIKIFLGLLGLIVVILFLYAGFLWMTASGSVEKVEKAKKTLKNAVIGLVIVLSAWGIVSWVVKVFIDVTEKCTEGQTRSCGCGSMGEQTCTGGVWSVCSGDCLPGACCVAGACQPCGGSNVLSASIYPSGKWAVPLNGMGVVRFNRKVDPASGNFSSNYAASPTDTGAAVTFDTNLKYFTNLEYNNQSTCIDVKNEFPTANIIIPSGHELDKCFKPDMDPAADKFNTGYRVEVQSYKTPEGLMLDCGIKPCTSNFSATSTLDFSPPKISFDYRTMCVNTNNTLSAWISDDWGVLEAGFYVDGNFISTSTPTSITRNFTATAATNIINTPGDHQVRIVALDIANNSSTGDFTVKAWPDHCCNGVKDVDETDIDCGGSCAACEGNACAKDMTVPLCGAGDVCMDSWCSSYFCSCEAEDVPPGNCSTAGYGSDLDECCICRNRPIIDWITPMGGFCEADPNRPCATFADCTMLPSVVCDQNTPNSAAGNFVTVGGRYFGSYLAGKSKIFFDGVEAKLANDPVDGNPICGNDVWSDRQITAVMPAGTGNNPVIKVQAQNSYIDETDDTRGPLLNFIKNNITRPGICRLTPDSGMMNATIVYDGIRLLNGSAFFGNLIDYVPAFNSALGGEKQGTAQVPNIQTGRTTSYATVSGVNSNFLLFDKLSDITAGPEIVSFEPEKGKTGQYATIRGRGFGSSKGSSRVFFGPSGGNEADYQFPAICAQSVWQNNQVIVKVPGGIGDGGYVITMDLGDKGIIDTMDLSPSQFTVDSSLPLKPSICKILPTMGQPNSPVRMWGEYFDAKGPNSKVRFNIAKDMTGTDITFWDLDPTVLTGIKPYRADTKVHDKAVTGPVYIVKDFPESVGNGMNFTVGICQTNEDCGTGFCCPKATPASGRCMTDLQECYPEIRSSVYEANFSTGGVIYCDSDTTNKQCDPSDAMCDSGFRCHPNSCECLKNCDEDLATPSCEPKNEMCGKTDVCDEELCLCVPYCDSNTSAPLCQPDSALCPNSLPYCEPKSCKCTTPPEDSCMGYNLNLCSNFLCPNSPGNCSVGSTTPLKISCDCDELYPLKGLAYNADNDRCAKASLACSVDEDAVVTTITPGISLEGYDAQCRYVKRLKGNFWQIDPGLGSCPNANWYLEDNDNGWCTLGTTGASPAYAACDICTDLSGVSYSCVADGAADNAGLCVANQDICPSNYICGADKTCKADLGKTCECCCRKANENQDCCTPLECEGKCGSDALGTDTDTYGYCTGCTTDLDGNPAIITQAEIDASDEKCVCSHTNGKYCDMEAAGGKGICRDCQQLVTGNLCSRHYETCCVDNMNGNECRGTIGDSDGNTGIIIGDNPDLAYCEYFKCTDDNKSCDAGKPVASSTQENYTTFRTKKICDDKCGGNPGGSSCYNPVESLCNLKCSSPYLCLGSSGCYDSTSTPQYASCSAGDNSCFCCCDPALPASEDTCKQLDNGKLWCEADKAPCNATEPGDEGKRGLCCGCSEDIDCVPPGGIPYKEGCGNDYCCRERPTVTKTVPDDNATDVCRNPMITAEFSEYMDISTFSGNVLMVGDYGSDPCPVDTKFLADLGDGFDYAKADLFARVYHQISYTIKNMLRKAVFFARAFPLPSSQHYCAVPLTVTGYNQTVSSGPGYGVMKIRPDILLAENRLYYVIIKGDQHLNSKSGVLSYYKIGLDAGNSTTTFSSIPFHNAYIWSFTTKPITAPDVGVCKLNHVTIRPKSYLFRTVQNNTADDPPFSLEDNTDSDVVFRSEAFSVDQQRIAPIPGVYSWIWDWWSEDDRIADIVDKLANSNFQNVRAKNVKEGDTFIVTRAAIDVDEVMVRSTVGSYKTAKAPVHIMLCENPWPEINSDWSWSPWCDDSGNCIPESGTCYNNNFCISYCRDSGGVGTKDDLPAILDKAPIIRGEAPTQNILKEYYFFREALPYTGGVDLRSVNTTDTDKGGVVGLNWNSAVAALGEVIKEYVVYYGTASGTYNKFINTGSNSAYIGPANPFLVRNLENGTDYYFALTVKYLSGAESPYSNQIKVTPKDVYPPAIPSGFTATSTPGSDQVELSWSENSDDTVSYKVYWGVNPGIYGGNKNVGDNTSAEITADNTSVPFYFTVTAIDQYKNESAKAPEIKFIFQ